MRLTLLPVTLLALTVSFGGDAGAAEGPSGTDATTQDGSDGRLLVIPGETPPPGKEGENCAWGCARWGKQCDVDVRGVRRCRTICEKFDKQCQ